MNDFVLSCYREIMIADDVMKVGETILIPQFNEELIGKIIMQSIDNLVKEKPMVRRNGCFVIVGDIHGSLHDLLRIFRMYGYPPNQKYIFLGDYVDRGEFSIDVMTLLFALYNSFPEHITLIRGNHEFLEINSAYGFKRECLERFGNDTIFNLFNKAFCFLPLSSIVNNDIFCVHGGITQQINSTEDLEKLSYFHPEHRDMIHEMVWSDPSHKPISYSSNPRGLGKTFGLIALNEFLGKTGLKIIIRAHQCVDGYSTMFNRRLITVFSSSNYSPEAANSSGVVLVSERNCMPVKIKSIDRIKKSDCNYLPITRPVETDPKQKAGLIQRKRVMMKVGVPKHFSQTRLTSPLSVSRSLSCRKLATLSGRNH